MSKYDGSLQLDGRVTPLMEVMLWRRSVRKYAKGRATAAQVAYILGCVDRFITRVRFTAPRISVVEGEERAAVVRGATRGVIGKVNPWLPRTKAEHLILCGAVYPQDAGDQAGVERAIKEAAMAMQVAVLAAAELELATCWMAGINHDSVEQAHSLPDGARLVAISTLGHKPARMGVSWDALSYHLVSKRRKALKTLWMSERWEPGS